MFKIEHNRFVLKYKHYLTMNFGDIKAYSVNYFRAKKIIFSFGCHKFTRLKAISNSPATYSLCCELLVLYKKLAYISKKGFALMIFKTKNLYLTQTST